MFVDSQMTRRVPSAFSRLALACVAGALLSAAPGQQGALAAPASVSDAQAPAVAGARNYSVSFRQLGAAYPLELHGVQGTGGVKFGVRNDEVVTAARLHLNYAYSPALISQLSHLRVLVNEQVVATIPVPNEHGGRSLQTVVDIPTRVISEFNRLNIQLIGHYTMECEDPAHSSLWANIGNDSRLELSVKSLALSNDLAFLPEPFFDRRDARHLTLPIVFARSPDASQLEAAGTLSSWFGSLAGFRGADFPAAVGQIPERGHAIVLLQGNDKLAGVSASSSNGPSISVVDHPSDPGSKLLLISGRDNQELKLAATALAVGRPALSGPSATIAQLTQIKPRQPYDAPNWLSSERAVKFGELVEPEMLNVSGYSPDLIRVNFRMPPDLFGWRSPGVPVQLKYRYSARPVTDKSSLNISVNESFLRGLPLRAEDAGASGLLERTKHMLKPKSSDLLPAEEFFHIPLFKLPARNQLQFHYYYDLIKQGACKDVVLDNVRGTVEPDSTIDISGFPHFMAMPDLAAFSNSGFPFSRMADLSESAVILPERPEAGDYSAYLSLMGLMGNVTGYPAHGVTVALGGQQIDALADKDLLVIGSSANQPLLKQWADNLPFSLSPEAKRFKLSDYASRLIRWWEPEPRNHVHAGGSELIFSSNSNDAVIAGFESPLRSGRSVVLLASNQPAGLQHAVAALLDADRVKDVQGSLSVVRGSKVDSLLAEQSYFLGRLGPLTYLQWWLSRHPLATVLLGVALAAISALLLYIVLRARARRRLQAQKA
ncbi:cellulose biosynthesis cyclic di-GMP-binding regulatory protein BcsB [Comamonas composti]|uniref:cellulose biosynthesis cyclic di-GMP-binding regulatory protein BcsB n=1 Tax=Comamonas composti TaxID=408558 RepID=UPI0004013887|nr:cellulose biosynthesis cyclic di-GMP-binding regulatory protein BcsB [Comamonas composti]